MLDDTIAKSEQFFFQFPRKQYKKGEIVIQPESNPNGAFYLKDGYVRAYGISPQGVEVTLHLFTPGSYFPMMWVMADIPNRYYYEALTNIELYTASKDEILAFLSQNPAILQNLTIRVFRGVDKLIARIEQLVYGKAYERVVSTILYLARHFGKPKNNTVIISQKFTHRDIGAMAGITRETTSREWEKLEKKGLITYQNQYIIINDLEKLKQELSS